MLLHHLLRVPRRHAGFNGSARQHYEPNSSVFDPDARFCHVKVKSAAHDISPGTYNLPTVFSRRGSTPAVFSRLACQDTCPNCCLIALLSLYPGLYQGGVSGVSFLPELYEACCIPWRKTCDDELQVYTCTTCDRAARYPTSLYGDYSVTEG
jgi:hypothetical protein